MNRLFAGTKTDPRYKTDSWVMTLHHRYQLNDAYAMAIAKIINDRLDRGENGRN